MSGYKQDTHARAIWPPVRLVEMEKQLGESFADWMLRDLEATGSVRTSGQNLERLTGVPAQTSSRDWWDIMCRNDPELKRQANEQRESGRHINRLLRDAPRIERKGLLAEIGQVKNAVEGKCCHVCGAPLPTFRMREDTATCSPECSHLWRETRYHIDDETRDKHRRLVARRILETERSETDVRYAKRVLAEAELQDRGRWITSPTVRVQLQTVMDRRAQAKERWGDLAADLPPIKVLEKKSA